MKQVSRSCKALIKAHEDTIRWLKDNNEGGHHDRSILRREKELERLKADPF